MKNDTLKKFRKGLGETFVTGISNEEWQCKMEDGACNYAEPVYQDGADHASSANEAIRRMMRAVVEA